MLPDKVEKLCQRAQQAIAERDWEKAKQVYLMALGIRSDLPDVHYGLATVYFHLSELTSAAHHFREVTRLDPLRAGAYVNLLADGPGRRLYARHGFTETAPASLGMARTLPGQVR